MKFKNITKYLVIAALALQLVSCDNNDSAEALFDNTPTERLNAQKKELNDLLMSSQYGWKTVYFTDSTQLGGFTHLMKFKDGKVEMASDFDNDIAVYPSEYSIDLGSTVSLVFTTKNKIHLLSDSNNYPTDALRGKGYKGDFQFLYYGQENGDILFKTNRSFSNLRFVKATAEDWNDLPKNRIVADLLGSPLRPLFGSLETNDGTTSTFYNLDYGSKTRFAYVSTISGDFTQNTDLGFAYTPTGITVNPAVKVNGQELKDFTLDTTTGEFVATGTNGVKAVIKYGNTPLVLTNDYKVALPTAGSPSNAYGYIAANLAGAQTNSPLCNMLLNQINAALPATQKVNRVQFTFYSGGVAEILYSFTGGKASIYHRVSVTEDTVNKTIILKNTFWHNGAAIIAAPELVKNIDEKLLDPKGLYVKKEKFTIQYTNTIYTFTSASSSFRITTYAFQ